MTDHNDDDQHWLETVLAGLEERSEAVKQALMEAVTGREGAGPLLGTIFHPSLVRGKDVISSKLNFFRSLIAP